MDKILRPHQESEGQSSSNNQGRSMDQYKKGQNQHITGDEDHGSSGSTGSQGGTKVSGSNDSQSGSSTSR